MVLKTYDLTLWLLERTASFSRAHRHTLGTRIESAALEALETLVEASYSREKVPLLDVANRRLQSLRYLLRLAQDLKLLATSQYEFASRSLHTIGTELGAWLKSARPIAYEASQEPLPADTLI